MDDFIPTNNGFGIVTGTATPVSLPNIQAYSLRIKAGTPQSIGYLGSYGTAVFPLLQGEDTGWTDVDNISDLFYQGTGAFFYYWYQS